MNAHARLPERQLDLLRIRKTRAWLLETLSLEADQAGSSHVAEINDKLAKLERYERRAFFRRNTMVPVARTPSFTFADEPPPNSSVAEPLI